MVAFKLDENLSPSLKAPLAMAGHDVRTVADEDFGQVLAYPPADYAGLIVLRDPRSPLRGLRDRLHDLVQALASESPRGKLWIVEPGRIRVYEPEQ